MLTLPRRITAQLVDPSGRHLAIRDVVIAINLLVQGRYYYGNVLGLTGPSGAVGLDRDELALRFASDQSLFPMDYKVDLEECDPMLEVTIMSSEEVEAALKGMVESKIGSPAIRADYERSRNAAVQPALSRVWGDLPGAGTLTVLLTTNASGTGPD